MTQTGPASAEAKAIVSRNRIRHGLRTQAIVIPGLESEDDWGEFRLSVFDAAAPHGAIEVELTQRVAETMWRLRRVASAEHDAIVVEHQRLDREIERLRQLEIRFAPQLQPEDLQHGPQPPLPILAPEKTRDAITRYEAHLNRQLYQALHELEGARERRAGRASPLARIDVNATEHENCRTIDLPLAPKTAEQ